MGVSEDRGQKTEHSSVGRVSPSVTRQDRGTLLDNTTPLTKHRRQVTKNKNMQKTGGDGYLEYSVTIIYLFRNGLTTLCQAAGVALACLYPASLPDTVHRSQPVYTLLCVVSGQVPVYVWAAR